MTSTLPTTPPPGRLRLAPRLLALAAVAAFGAGAGHPAAVAARSTPVPPPRVLQARSGPDTLHLADLQARARAADPRRDEAALRVSASSLRSENLGTDRLPNLLLRGDAAYQSETVTLPIALPGGQQPPLERYAAAVETDWTLWDGGLTGARRRAEGAALSSALAELDAELDELRSQVADAFFSALLLQEQERELAVTEGDINARLQDVRERVLAGVGLAGDTATLRAEMLRIRQQADAVRARRASALATLASLADLAIPPDAVLALPGLDRPVDAARQAVAGLEPADPAAADPAGPDVLPDPLRRHPAFAALDARRAATERQAAVIRASRRPRISAFGQLAYGSPGFRQFDDAFHEYWQAGLRVQWQPWEWSRARREVEELHLQARMVDAREALFTRRLLRALDAPARRLEQLTEALRLDDEIIGLRELAEAQARARFEERTISASAWTDARSDVQDARIARIRHRIERVQTQARYLMTLGLELR